MGDVFLVTSMAMRMPCNSLQGQYCPGMQRALQQKSKDLFVLLTVLNGS